MENYDFITIPRLVVLSDKIRDSDRIVYGVIYSMSQMTNKKCIAKNTTLAKMSGLSTGSVANSLVRLVEAGFIQTTFKDGAKRFRLEIIPLISYNNDGYHQMMKGVSSNDETRVSSNDEQNNIYYTNKNINICRDFKNRILKELYKINDKVYLTGQTKNQEAYWVALNKDGVADCPAEKIIQWYVAEFIKRQNIGGDDFKFFPKAIVPSQLVEKWDSIERLYKETNKEYKPLW